MEILNDVEYTNQRNLFYMDNADFKRKKKTLINIKFLKIYSTGKSNWDVELNSYLILSQCLNREKTINE